MNLTREDSDANRVVILVVRTLIRYYCTLLEYTVLEYEFMDQDISEEI